METIPMPSFDEFKAYLDNLTQRREGLAGEIKTMNEELETSLASFDEVVLNGEDSEKLKDNLDSLQRRIALKEREQGLLEAALKGQVKAGKVLALAKNVIQEAYDLIPGPLRQEWDAQAEKAKRAKEAFLQEVRKLGQINSRASTVSARANHASDFMGSPKPGVPSLATGVHPVHKTGIIYLDPSETEAAFFGGA
jgi:hypothetical protein